MDLRSAPPKDTPMTSKELPEQVLVAEVVQGGEDLVQLGLGQRRRRLGHFGADDENQGILLLTLFAELEKKILISLFESDFGLGGIQPDLGQGCDLFAAAFGLFGAGDFIDQPIHGHRIGRRDVLGPDHAPCGPLALEFQHFGTAAFERPLDDDAGEISVLERLVLVVQTGEQPLFRFFGFLGRFHLRPKKSAKRATKTNPNKMPVVRRFMAVQPR